MLMVTCVVFHSMRPQLLASLASCQRFWVSTTVHTSTIYIHEYYKYFLLFVGCMFRLRERISTIFSRGNYGASGKISLGTWGLTSILCPFYPS